MAGDETTANEQEIRSAVESRLDQVRFDLHDGPQQDIHLLAQDLRLFREQLLPAIDGDPNRDRFVGRLDDLAAQLRALDDSVRQLSTSLKSPPLSPGSMSEAVAEITQAFAARTGIAPRVQLTGELDSLTGSQQIALLAVVREALSNVRKHGDATTVSVSVSAGTDGIEAEIADDGRGFVPDTRLGQARRDGHLGVVGMQERIRLVGGETRITSRPGGPTVVSASLPWRKPPR
jgi:signal transduction histidine kinase